MTKADSGPNCIITERGLSATPTWGASRQGGSAQPQGCFRHSLIALTAGIVLNTDEETGPLPLTLTAPSDDGILIAIESVDADDEGFRGGYTIEVTSEDGSVGDRLTEPRTDVED
jgi:hypothetical protein